MYLKWQEKTTSDFSDDNVNNLYNEGFVFTRRGKGMMDQTRSLRIDLSKFETSSENRRILRKTEGVSMTVEPLPYSDYSWQIHKLGKDFYTEKFGDKTFSANKIKELMTDKDKSNFNKVFVYSVGDEKLGYCIALETNEIVHYSYPFYDLEKSPDNIGLGMMLKAILYAKGQYPPLTKRGKASKASQGESKKYIYLGSFQRPGDKYKLQFSGLEWFDGKEWRRDLEALRSQKNSDKQTVRSGAKKLTYALLIPAIISVIVGIILILGFFLRIIPPYQESILWIALHLPYLFVLLFGLLSKNKAALLAGVLGLGVFLFNIASVVFRPPLPVVPGYLILVLALVVLAANVNAFARFVIDKKIIASTLFAILTVAQTGLIIFGVWLYLTL